MPTCSDIINDIIQREGGFVDHPDDRGGPTMYGITLQTLSLFRDRVCTVEELQSMSMDEARMIYQDRYIRIPGFWQIGHPRLLALVVDMGVHHGVDGAVRMIQEALKVNVDGIFGPKTLEAVNAMDWMTVYVLLLARRGDKIGNILDHDHSQVVFAKGWIKRDITDWLRAIAR